MIHELKAQGLSISEIARRSNMDRKTVRHHLKRGRSSPRYGPRPRPGSLIDPHRSYLEQRLADYPDLSATRLMREIVEQGYTGGYTTVKAAVRGIRPPRQQHFERRFETPPGQQAQVDFAQFKVNFRSDPSATRVIWLFSMVMGYSRFLFCRFVWRQTLDNVLRCHIEAFNEIGGVPRQILYDRMKTAVLGEPEPGEIIYHPVLMSLAEHYGFQPQACRAYRPQTKGKVARPFRYVRQDFFLGTAFDDMDHLNARLDAWREGVAHARAHGTTGRIITEALAHEQPLLGKLPHGEFGDVLSLERRVTRDGMVSIDGNLYSIPDGTRSRTVDVQRTANTLRILDHGQAIAEHALLSGRGQRSVLPFHRAPRSRPPAIREGRQTVCLTPPGHVIKERSLEVYQRIGEAKARGMQA